MQASHGSHMQTNTFTSDRLPLYSLSGTYTIVPTPLCIRKYVRCSNETKTQYNATSHNGYDYRKTKEYVCMAVCRRQIEQRRLCSVHDNRFTCVARRKMWHVVTVNGTANFPPSFTINYLNFNSNTNSNLDDVLDLFVIEWALDMT